METASYTHRFLPHRKKGTLILGAMTFSAFATSLVSFWLSSLAGESWLFALYLTLGILFLLPLPMLSYRLLALNRAFYEMNRDYLTIHWGLRSEIIPIRELEWVRSVTDLIEPLLKPRLPLPGALLGIRQVDGLGRVEYLADGLTNALLVAAPGTVYVISPEPAREFLSIYHRNVEMGSVEQVFAYSIRPSFILGKLWDSQMMRGLFLSGFLINAAVFIWAILLIISRQQVTFGYSAVAPAEPAPAIRLLLLPVLSVIIFLVDTIAGAFFFRLEEQKFISYMLYAGSSITALLIMISLFLMTISP
ncbi:MAG: hypothetical protein C0391_06725 [Anaerolinea sp.]|nr:hypothetical protein [Anaerolinea sp.]